MLQWLCLAWVSVAALSPSCSNAHKSQTRTAVTTFQYEDTIVSWILPWRILWAPLCLSDGCSFHSLDGAVGKWRQEQWCHVAAVRKFKYWTLNLLQTSIVHWRIICIGDDRNLIQQSTEILFNDNLTLSVKLNWHDLPETYLYGESLSLWLKRWRSALAIHYSSSTSNQSITHISNAPYVTCQSEARTLRSRSWGQFFANIFGLQPRNIPSEFGKINYST